MNKVELCCFSLYDMFGSNKVTRYFHYLAQLLVSLKADFLTKLPITKGYHVLISSRHMDFKLEFAT